MPLIKIFNYFEEKFKRGIYLIALFTLAISFNSIAQVPNNPDSLRTDSLNKANQTKIYNDSLQAAAKKNTATSSQTGATKQRDTRPLSQRIFFDISTSFWINPSNTYFQFFPSIGYRFPKTLSIGAGPVFVYNHDRTSQVDLNGWGGSVYGRAQLLKWFYAYTEYQGIDNQHVTGINPVTKEREYVDSWFLSLGINIRIGRRHGFNLQALYDVLYNKETSPYYSAWTYRVGFGF